MIAIALMIDQFGGLFTGNVNVIGLICTAVILIGMIFMLVSRPDVQCVGRHFEHYPYRPRLVLNDIGDIPPI